MDLSAIVARQIQTSNVPVRHSDSGSFCPIISEQEVDGRAHMTILLSIRLATTINTQAERYIKTLKMQGNLRVIRLFVVHVLSR